MSNAADQLFRRRHPLVGNGMSITAVRRLPSAGALGEREYLVHIDATNPVAITLSEDRTDGSRALYDGREHVFVRAAGASDITINADTKLINGAASRVMGAGETSLTLRYSEALDAWFER